MDEAERCKRIVYLAQGRIVVQGGAASVVQQSGLVTFEGTGEGVDRAAVALRHTAGVEAAAVFGRALRIASLDREALKHAIETNGAGLVWEEVEPRLDDVFIHMLSVQEARA